MGFTSGAINGFLILGTTILAGLGVVVVVVVVVVVEVVASVEGLFLKEFESIATKGDLGSSG